MIKEVLDTKEKIVNWLDSMKIFNYIINDDLTVDVYGSVDLAHYNFKKIPVRFGKVKENFY